MEHIDFNPQEVAIVCKEVASEGKPILRATRDEQDGGWQFLCGVVSHGVKEDTTGTEVWGLGEVVAHEPSLSHYLHLPAGTNLHRDSASTEWVVR